MEHITSLKNPKVAAWKALKDRKGRRESGCFLVEGRKMVEEALASAFDVETVLVQEGMELPDGLTMPVYELPEHVLTAVCDTRTPQGIAAVVRMKEQSALGKHIVVLDGVQDPGNVGTIIRTADAAGLDGVVCSPLEAGAIHRRCGADFLTVTPGVRFAGGAPETQEHGRAVSDR